MAARVIAQLLVAGGTILFRAGAQAYRQAIVNAGKAGVGKDAASATRMSLDEAYKILGVEKNASLEEVLKRYQHLFDVNAKHSFYLQSKVHRAREAIEAAAKEEGGHPP